MNMRMGVVCFLYKRDHGSALMRGVGKKGRRRPEWKLFVSTGDIATGWQRTKTGRVLE